MTIGQNKPKPLRLPRPQPCGCYTGHRRSCHLFVPGLQAERMRAAREAVRAVPGVRP